MRTFDQMGQLFSLSTLFAILKVSLLHQDSKSPMLEMQCSHTKTPGLHDEHGLPDGDEDEEEDDNTMPTRTVTEVQRAHRSAVGFHIGVIFFVEENRFQDLLPRFDCGQITVTSLSLGFLICEMREQICQSSWESQRIQHMSLVQCQAPNKRPMNDIYYQ